jgi:hypothetical protein
MTRKTTPQTGPKPFGPPAGPRNNGAVWTGRHRPTPRPLCHCGSLAFWQCEGPPRAVDAVRCGRWLCRIHRIHADAAHTYCPWHKKHAEDAEP